MNALYLWYINVRVQAKLLWYRIWNPAPPAIRIELPDPRPKRNKVATMTKRRKQNASADTSKKPKARPKKQKAV